MANLFHNVPSGEGDIVNVVVEVPKGSRNKYEYDKELEAIVLDRVLHSPFFYPVNYGFVPRTWYDDGDPLDAMVLARDPVVPATVVEARVIGLLRMKDEKGVDDKILAVPTGDPAFKGYKDLTDVESAVLDEIAHFFERYKDLEKGKTSEVVGWYARDKALEALEYARKLYQEKFKG